MDREVLFRILAIAIVLVMLLFNKKVCILAVIKKQLLIFKNAETGKISLWDIICFIVMPIILSIIITYEIGCPIDDNMAMLLTTIFAIVFTVLFGFAALIIGKKESDDELQNQIVDETFVSIVSSTILSLQVTILSIVFTKIDNTNVENIISVIIYTLCFINIMLLLMITKRTFIVYCNNEDA